MLRRIFGQRQNQTTSTNEDLIIQSKNRLIAGQDADSSAKKLGDIAINYKNKMALSSLWEAIEKTRNLTTIIDPCAYTVARIIWEGADPELEDMGFDIFAKSVLTRTDLIIDKFAYAMGDVALKTSSNETQQRAWNFITHYSQSADFIVRTRYTYTKNRVSHSLSDQH